ncbi:MAG: NADP(H)-dependent aldo-keto reductase [Gammaproteobacteria bacterium]
MQFNELGKTGIRVSKICLGTMTFGEQNTEAEAHEQISYAVNEGVNFIDTAEMYPVPPKEQTQGKTEEYIGTWLKKTGKRKDIVLATKVSGPGMMPYLRGGVQLIPEQINAALESSLKRLQTDYVDLYQIHWPARNTNYFGSLGYQQDNDNDELDSTMLMEDAYACLVKAVEQGKVRHIGISNETPWGAMQFQLIAQKNSWPSMASIQNPYSLLNRTYEVGLAEVSHREQMGLLAYSPLGFGVLSGKYIDSTPANARLTLYERFNRYSNLQGVSATAAYVKLAQESGYSPTQMALAFVNMQPFITANIIGATSMQQLKENIDSIHIKLSSEVLENIELIHQQHPNPCP